MGEHSQKIDLLRALMARSHFDAIHLQRVSNFAWLTCGAASYVNQAATNSDSSLLITANHKYLISNNIEASRLEKEEGLKEQGWDFQLRSWYENSDIVARLAHGASLAADASIPGATDISTQLARLRVTLFPEEVGRFRDLGVLCAQAMEAACRAVRPGLSEYEIAGRLAGEAENRGVQVIVNLIGTDQRIFDFRHPLPTAKKLKRYAMLVLCGRRRGLVCSITRLVHFGRLPEEIHRKAGAVARIDAVMIAATRPGRSLGEVFQRAVQAYADWGYPDEWHLHHQGGPAGYEPREYVATLASADIVAAGQVYAWNPSITGTKSEDTILVGEKGNEILTAMEGWPSLAVEVEGQTIERPSILEVT